VQQPIAVRKKHVQVHAFTRVDVDTERVLVRRVWEGFVQSVRRVLRETGARNLEKTKMFGEFYHSNDRVVSV
jgi:hypothetical protein